MPTEKSALRERNFLYFCGREIAKTLSADYISEPDEKNMGV